MIDIRAYLDDDLDALWKRLGFEIIGTAPRAFRDARGQLLDLYIMHRRL